MERFSRWEETKLISVELTVASALHLIAVYVAMMGPLVCLWLQWKARRDEAAAGLDRFLLWAAVIALLAAAALGGVAAALIGCSFPDAYLAAVRVLPRSRLWPFGAVELVFSLGCFALAAALAERAKETRSFFGVRWTATALGCANLLYHFPTLFVMLGVLSVRPRAWGQHLKFTALLADHEVLARLAHHFLAALVVVGMVVAWRGARRGGEAAKTIVWGSRLALAALVCQVFSGLWLIMTMPAGSRQMLMGQDPVASGLFAAALLGAFFAVPGIAASAFGTTDRRTVAINVLLILTIVVLMTATRHRTRDLQRREGLAATPVGRVVTFDVKQKRTMETKDASSFARRPSA